MVALQIALDVLLDNHNLAPDPQNGHLALLNDRPHFCLPDAHQPCRLRHREFFGVEQAETTRPTSIIGR